MAAKQTGILAQLGDLLIRAAMAKQRETGLEGPVAKRSLKAGQAQAEDPAAQSNFTLGGGSEQKE